mmetsp:Transcript_65270/g.155957  ORF Transcript_65270/g.155957 Transcript_65270/m.155957 type:complete len:222 (-) Transcript_65270:1081-1746(-)
MEAGGRQNFWRAGIHRGVPTSDLYLHDKCLLVADHDVIRCKHILAHKQFGGRCIIVLGHLRNARRKFIDLLSVGHVGGVQHAQPPSTGGETQGYGLPLSVRSWPTVVFPHCDPAGSTYGGKARNQCRRHPSLGPFVRGSPRAALGQSLQAIPLCSRLFAWLGLLGRHVHAGSLLLGSRVPQCQTRRGGRPSRRRGFACVHCAQGRVVLPASRLATGDRRTD